MTISERKYRIQLEELVDKCINEVFDASYDMPKVGDLSQFRYKHAGGENGRDFTTAVANDDFTPIKYGPLNHGWKTVTAINGMMGWFDRKDRKHPIMNDIGWLDWCSDFSPGRSAIASGMKDGIKYYVYKNGKYQKDSKRFTRTTTDAQGRTNTKDEIAANVRNHDGTPTTHNITTNVRTAANPNGTWDPTKFIRYATADKEFFMKFVMVWAQHFGNNSQYRTGFNDEDSTYFIDIQNGPGIYAAVVELDSNLGSSINVNQIDKETWNQMNGYNGASGRFFEGRLRSLGKSFFDYDNDGQDDEASYEPERLQDVGAEQNGGNTAQGWNANNAGDAGDTAQLFHGSIVFGEDIPYDSEQDGNGQQQQGQQQQGQQQQQQPNQSFETETMQVSYYGFFNNTTCQWVFRIDQGLWLNAEDGSKIGTVKVKPNLMQWEFTLTHNNGNQFNFVIRDNQLKDSGKGYEIADNVQLFYSTPNTMSANRGIGCMDIIYTHKMKDNINLFENGGRLCLSESEFRGLMEKIVRTMINERFDMLEGSATWDVANAMYDAGLGEEECDMCSALDDEYRIRFNGSADSGGWDTPPNYDHTPDKGDVREVERDIMAIPDGKVRDAMLAQFRSWLETAQPDMDFAGNPHIGNYMDDF